MKIGQNVLFRHKNTSQDLAAIVVKVFSENCVNLAYWDAEGAPGRALEVPVCRKDDLPDGCDCCFVADEPEEAELVEEEVRSAPKAEKKEQDQLEKGEQEHKAHTATQPQGQEPGQIPGKIEPVEPGREEPSPRERELTPHKTPHPEYKGYGGRK